MRRLLPRILGRSGENGMLHIEHFRIRCSLQIPLSLMLTLAILMFCTPNVFCSGERYYYYLHISSFRLKESAVRDVARTRNQGYDAIAKRERVPGKGYWYRVYIGPFSSLLEAKLKREELRRQKFVEYVAINKNESLIVDDLEEKKAPVSLPPEAGPVVPAKPAEVPAAPEKPPAPKKVPVPIPSMEEREQVKRPLPAAPTKPPARISAKPPRKMREFAPKGSGRNMGLGNFSLGLQHTYRKVQPEVTKRKCITSDGTTTTIEDISVTGPEKDDFTTSVHMDSLCIRYGLADYLEVFAEIGGAYREFSDLGFVYGGGLRLNLFEVKGGWLRGFYGGLQGEYLGGTVEYEYSSFQGNKWEKEAEWQEFVGKVELGLTRSRVSTYIGGAYFHYREDTERQQLENLPPSFTSFVLKDELEEEGLYAFGGIDVNLTSTVLVNIEGQVGSQKGIVGRLEYHF